MKDLYHSGSLLALRLFVCLCLSLSGCGTTATLFPDDLATISGEPAKLVARFPAGFPRLYSQPRSIDFVSSDNERFAFKDVVGRAHSLAELVEQKFDLAGEEDVFAESAVKIVSISPMAFIMRPGQVPLWSEDRPLPSFAIYRSITPILVDNVIRTNKFSFSSNPSLSSGELLVIADLESIHVFELSGVESQESAIYRAGEWTINVDPTTGVPRRHVSVRKASIYDEGHVRNFIRPIIILPAP